MPARALGLEPRDALAQALCMSTAKSCRALTDHTDLALKPGEDVGYMYFYVGMIDALVDFRYR